MLIPELIAAGGLLFAFEHATVAGKLVLSLLAIVSVFSWSIMITKLRVIRFARKQNARFLAAFRQDRQPLRLFEKNARLPGSPNFNVYRAGCQEMTFHLLGSPEVDETFRARLEIADKISPAQMGAVNAAMERAVGETALDLESQMIDRRERFAISGTARHGLGRDGRVQRSGRGRHRQPWRDGTRRVWRAHYHRHRALRRDSGNVRLQFFGHQHPRHDRGDGQLCGRARL